MFYLKTNFHNFGFCNRVEEKVTTTMQLQRAHEKIFFQVVLERKQSPNKTVANEQLIARTYWRCQGWMVEINLAVINDF